MQLDQIERDECKTCQRCLYDAYHPMMPMHGDLPCDILIIGDAPDMDEARSGRAFTGRSSTFLQNMLTKAGLHQYRIAYTNAVRCWAPNNDPKAKTVFKRAPTVKEVKLCHDLLLADIEKAQPKLIIPMGSAATSSAMGRGAITKIRGQIIRKDGHVFTPTYHPNYVWQDRRHEKTFLNDLRAAAQLLNDMASEKSLSERLQDKYEVIMTRAQFDAVIATALTQPSLGLDTEFYPLDALSEPRVCYGVILAWAQPGAGNRSVFIPVDHPESPFLDDPDIKAQLAHVVRTIPIKVHNAEADVETLWDCLGVHPKELKGVTCTMAQALALNGPTTSVALKSLVHSEAPAIAGYENDLQKFVAQANACHKVLGSEALKATPELSREAYDFYQANNVNGKLFDGRDYGDIPLTILANPYGAGDGDATLLLDAVQSSRIKSTRQSNWFTLVGNRAWRLNLEIRRSGLLVDWDEWRWRYEYYRAEKQRVYQEIRNYPAAREFVSVTEEQKKKFSLRSGNQMRALLFTVLGFTPSGNKTKGHKDQLDYTSIMNIKSLNHGHPDIPILDMILAVASIDKMLGTYIEGYAKVVYPDGRVHPRVHNFTESGRRGTTAPNVQNTPIGTEVTGLPKRRRPDNMRMLFRAAPGHKFIQRDYAQLEYRLAACYADDPVMLEGCRTGDPHLRVQNRFRFKNGKLHPEGEPMSRVAAKRVNFGIIYECSPMRLQLIFKDDCGIDVSLKDCTEIVRGMWTLYAKYESFVQTVHAHAREHGWVANQLGHRRWLPHAKGVTPADEDTYVAWERGQREASNHMEQSLGHDLLEIAAQAMLDFIWSHDLPWKIVNDMHDALLLEVPDADVDAASQLSQYYMEALPKRILGDWLQLDLPTEVAIGDHLGDLTVWHPAIEQAA